MRVIAGKYGGRPIHTPKGLPVRPTTDRTREALFNILNQYLDWEETDVLELFCGTAAVSLECMSRGAKSAKCVDQDRRCVLAAKKLFQEFGEQHVKVHKMKAEAFVKKCEEKFELIFMDPPYAMPKQEDLIHLIFERNLLKPESLLIVEHASQLSFDYLAGFDLKKVYGSSTLSFFRIPG